MELSVVNDCSLRGNMWTSGQSISRRARLPPSNRAISRDLNYLLAQLRYLDSLTKKLQNDAASIVDRRLIFDVMMESFAGTISKLKSDASIVHNPLFESAPVKIQVGKAELLKLQERLLSSVFLRILEMNKAQRTQIWHLPSEHWNDISWQAQEVVLFAKTSDFFSLHLWAFILQGRSCF